MRKAPESSVLVQTTLKLMETRSRKQTYAVLSRMTGIPQAWLEEFSRGNKKRPCAYRVEALYTYLSGKPVVLD